MKVSVNKVLVIADNYASGVRHRGLSSTHCTITGTLGSTGLVGSIDTFYSDEMSRELGLTIMGDVLLSLCAASHYDLVILWPVGDLGMNPLRSTMGMITDVLGIKVYMLRGDAIGPKEDVFSRSWFPFVSFMGFWDATVAHLGYSQNPKAIQSFTSPNPRYFYDRKLEQDIDVSMPGSIAKPNRVEYIEFLREHGVNVFTKKTDPYDPNVYTLSDEEYATIISRSKISLNFCQWQQYSKRKGRVFEAMACKSLLIEDEGIETKEFFDEGKDFIMVHSKEEMLEKVKYYLEHEKEREEIVESGYRKVTELYNARNEWGHALNKMDFDIPQSLAQDRHYQELYQKLEVTA